MYIKHEDSEPIELQGITCWIPPVGKVYDRFSGKWVDVEIKCRSRKKSEQYWERDELPSWYEKKRREEEKIILDTGNPDFFIEECEEVRRQQWFWRLNGRWFYNNGVPTYITGLHWFYLNWWPIGKVGYPWFFEYDRKRFYHIDYCIQDPYCFGRVEVGPRRMGKTYVGGVFVFEATSRVANTNGGIQSKTQPDGKKVFGKAIVSQFRKLPHFFKPVYDTSAGTIPKSEIRFFNTSKKGSSIKIEDLEKELESIIDFRSSEPLAYDGEEMIRILHDEIFKTKDIDVYERYKIVKECLVNTSTETIIGKYMGTSTVEEVEGQLESYQLMWDDSDPTAERDGNGHTRSGLYHYFISAAETRGIDKYGNCNYNKNVNTIQNSIANKSGKDASDYKRKYPLSIKDAFRPQAKDCQYDLEKLENRYDILSILEPKYITCDFRWIDPNDITKGVKVVPTKNGNFLLNKDIDPENGPWNNVQMSGSVAMPKNKAKFIGGNDPFDNKTVNDGRKSDGSTAIFYKYDPMNPLKSDKFVLVYKFRPKKPTIFYEDTLKMAWFFGCQILMENNKQGIIHYFDGSNPFGINLQKFMVYLPGRKEPGIPTTGATHDSIVDHTKEYIEDSIDKVDYPQLIKDWIQFDINNTTKFDLAMSSGICLIAANRFRKQEVAIKQEINDLSQIFAVY
jgi:hypothetical protein